MATLDGKDVPQCVQCTTYKSDAEERTVTKPTGAVTRVLCGDCAANINETYPVKPLRQSARPAVDDAPQAAAPSISRMNKAELLAEANKRNLDVDETWTVDDLRNALHVDDKEE